MQFASSFLTFFHATSPKLGLDFGVFQISSVQILAFCCNLYFYCKMITSFLFDSDIEKNYKFVKFASLHLQTPSLPGDFYYCLTVETDHLVCRNVDLYFNHNINNATTTDTYEDDDHPFRHARQRNFLNLSDHHRPLFCRYNSEPVLLTSRPWLGHLFPMCTSHFACLWIYITVIGNISYNLTLS